MIDTLGDRMKQYENAAKQVLPRRLPVIIRVDGRAFHTWTRGLGRPFDAGLMALMNQVALKLCEGIGGARLAYVQSDEISILMHGYRKLDSEPWFGNEMPKLLSISAAIASSTATALSPDIFGKIKPAQFDSRVFVVPDRDVANYFVWRQKDATRNSVSMLAQAHFSEKELHGKNRTTKIEMLRQKGIDWDALPATQRLGRVICKGDPVEVNGVARPRWTAIEEVPDFRSDREFINNLLQTEEDLAEREDATNE